MADGGGRAGVARRTSGGGAAGCFAGLGRAGEGGGFSGRHRVASDRRGGRGGAGGSVGVDLEITTEGKGRGQHGNGEAPPGRS